MAENFIRSPFYPTGNVDRVSQPGFKSVTPHLEALPR